MKSNVALTGKMGLFAGVALLALMVPAFAADGKAPPPLPAAALEAIQTVEPANAEPAKQPEAPTDDVAKDFADMLGAASAAEDAAVQNTGVDDNNGASAESDPAEAAVSAPAERQAADDDSARLAAEVPVEDVAIPAAEWLNQDVGSIATRPVAEGAEQAEPIAGQQPAPLTASTDVEAAPSHKPVDMEIGQSAIPGAIPGDVPGPAVPGDVAAPVVASEAEEPVEAPVAAQPTAPANANVVIHAEEAPVQPRSEPEQKTVSAPKVVTINADYRKPADKTKKAEAAEAGDDFAMKGDAEMQAPDAPVATNARFALVWIDGSQTSDDTFVKFFKPARQFFASGKECLNYAKAEATAGRALSPEGVQPGSLQAGCFSRDGSREFWTWRQRSGAFSKSVLLADQFSLFEDVVRQWSASSALAYGDGSETPYAGQ